MDGFGVDPPPSVEKIHTFYLFFFEGFPNVDKRENLEATRPYLWYPEWEKTEDMSDAASEGDGLRRAVRLRNHNGVDVLAEQV